MDAIRAAGVTRRFGTVEALRGLELNVPSGTVFGFLGPNGAGKTTTIHVLLGLLEPDAGHVEVLGHPVASHGDDVRAKCGVLLEHDGLYERLSLADNLQFHARAHELPRSVWQARIDRALDQAGLAGRSHHLAGTLSRGMKRRLAVARAFLTDPELVFLDEPTSGFDPAASAVLHDQMRNAARQEGRTVFVTTHDLHEAERICDRVAVISQGRVVAQGTPADLGTGDRHILMRGPKLDDILLEHLDGHPDAVSCVWSGRDLRIRIKAGRSASRIIRAAVEAGAELEEVRSVDGGLEEAFHSLMEAP